MLAWQSGLGIRGCHGLPVKLCGGKQVLYCHALKLRPEE